MAQLAALVEVFRSPDLRRLQLAWFATSTGIWCAELVLAIYAFGRAGAGAVGVMALVRTLPGAPLAPVLTWIADRVSRRTVLLVCNAVRALTIAAVAACAGADAPLGAIYALVAVLAIASPAYAPAQSALLPLLSRSPSELTSANAAASMLTNVGFLAGSLIGGILVSALSVAAVLAGVAAAIAVSLVPLLRIQRDAPPEPDPDARPLTELAEGFATVRGDRDLTLTLGIIGLWMFALGAGDVLVVSSALGFLDIGEAGAGYLSAAWGVGAVLGGIAVLPLLGRGRLTVALALGAILIGGPLALIGIAGVLAVAVAGLVVFGVGETFLGVSTNLQLQRQVPDHVLSRVFGVVEALTVTGVALGSLVAGVLITAEGTRTTYVVIGAATCAGILICCALMRGDEAVAAVPEREYGIVRANPVFAPLPVATTERLARSLSESHPADGEWVIRQGDPGDCVYLVAEGSLDIDVDGVHIRRVGPGDAFGEMALLRDAPRAGSVRASGGVTLLALEREEFLTSVTGLARSHRAAQRMADGRSADRPSRDAWIDAADAAARRGEHATALAFAERGLREFPDDRLLQELHARIAAGTSRA